VCVGTLQLVGLLLLLRGVAIGARLTECWLCCATVSVVSSRCGPRFLLLFSAALMVDLAPLPGGAFSAPRAVPTRLWYCLDGFAGRRNSASPR
jgi:hypothetical protein